MAHAVHAAQRVQPQAAVVPVPSADPGRTADELTPLSSDAQSLAEWLAPHREVIFRWAMGLAGQAPVGSDPEARRTFEETAQAVQRLHGDCRYVTWLYGESLLAAQRHASSGRLPEHMLAGLPPELRALLRLVSRGAMRAEEAWALLQRPMHAVRRGLVQVRLGRTDPPAPAGH